MSDLDGATGSKLEAEYRKMWFQFYNQRKKSRNRRGWRQQDIAREAAPPYTIARHEKVGNGQREQDHALRKQQLV